MRKWRFGVFAEQGKRGWKVRAYSLWYSPDWVGFLGHYYGAGETRAQAIRAALSIARADLDEGKRPYERPKQ